MTPDNKRAILEAAAKACGIDGIWQEGYGVFIKGNYTLNPGERPKFFNPIDNSLDTSAMCAVLDIDTYWFPKKNLVLCCRDGARTRYHHDEKHDGTPEGKEAAQRLAATMVAAKFGGYSE